MGVERCSSLASTGRYRTQGLNQVKEFEKLLYESGTTILKFFLHISKDE
jgi:polyphosphate kinase 2 (PPK2 family)